MNTNPAALLRLLGSGIQPAASPSAPATNTGGVQFQDMLEQARTGGVSSGIPIRVSRTAGVDLTGEQLARLSSAADRAEAAGASRALVMIDGMVLSMDVAQRTITGKADLAQTKVLNGVDAVVTVASGPGDVQGQLPPLNTAAMNASLLKVLGGRKPGAAIG